MSSADAKKLKQYIAQRTTEVIKISELKKIADQALTEKSLHNNFKSRARQMESIYENFEQHHSNIISIVSIQENGDLDPQNKIFIAFQNDYFHVQAIYTQLFEDARDMTVHLDNSVSSARQQNVKLPKIELPKFDGDLKTWQTFRDMFDSLIHNNDSLSNVEKFNYLVSTLRNAPLTLVKCTPITAQNYIVAYNALVNRYDNKRLIATSHWHSIEQTKKLSTPTGLHALLDTFSENVSVLENLGFPVTKWDFVLFIMLFDRLDSNTATRFELECGSDLIEEAYYSKLLEFLRKQCVALDSVNFSASNQTKKFEPLKNNKNVISQTSGGRQKLSSFIVDSHSSSFSCQLCNNDHAIYNCPTFISKAPNERFSLVKDKKWCTNCLGFKHTSTHCTSSSRCRKCSGKHHSLLHFEKQIASIPPPPNNPISSSGVSATNSECLTPAQSTNPPNRSSTNLFTNVDSTVLLSTALIDVQDKNGDFQKVRVVLDSASQSHFITSRCAKRLGITQRNSATSIHGIGRTNAHSSKIIESIIKPGNREGPILKLEFIVLPKLCSNMPSVNIPTTKVSQFHNLDLADPQFNITGPVDMLLGADIFGIIFKGNTISKSVNEPVAFDTIFGWVIMGRVDYSLPTIIPVTNSFVTSLDLSLDTNVKKFWELEQVPTAPTDTADDISAEKYFQSTFSRTSSGRYEVCLPFRNTEPEFNGSRDIALKRFFSLERRLLQNPSLHTQYCEFMQDYLTSGHMEVVPYESLNSTSYYIPHLCVVKPERSTTKLRVVFDASAKDFNNISLNDTLFTGPKLQRDIVSILLKFRLHKFVFTADIKQMYRQILVCSKHVDYQRILWRFSKSESVQDFRLRTVTYGINSSPYLAIRVLLQLSKDHQLQHPCAAKILEEEVYMDDAVTGSDSLSEAMFLQKDLIELLAKGGFELRKWASNHSALLNQFPLADLQYYPMSFDSDSGSTVKILGLQWNPSSDSFSFTVEPISRTCTKRIILSELARVFDPMGYLTPLTLFLKILIQNLWSQGIEWDSEPPENITRIWNQIKIELKSLSSLHIPRFVTCPDRSKCEIHGFCDASEKGYAAVIYMRSLNKNGDISTNILCSKSKVAPLKKISIPRLELCAALLLANLIDFVRNVIQNKIQIDQFFAWTDSTIVLSWIRSSPHKWATFVCNRVTQIQEKIPPSLWSHVRTHENPADPASRGLTPAELLDHKLWWAGPTWLTSLSSEWPSYSIDLNETEEEKRKINITLAADTESDYLNSLFIRHSSLTKIQNIMAYLLRFIHNLKCPDDRKHGPISLCESENSLLALVKLAQKCELSKEINWLQNKKLLPKSLRKLNPFIDQQGILRVGGRLVRSSLPFHQMHPALLPNSHRLTNLIIEHTHKLYLHPGIQTLHNLLLQRYWIISPKRTIRKVIANCYRCFRTNPLSLQPPMGNLPPARISQIKPFSQVGIDMAGPFTTSLGKVRGAKRFKSYLCIFVCMATKAIHIELVSEMTSEAFLAALRRFISRRGRCNHIFSDCGTNFVGASKYIAEIMTSAAAKEKITWHFNPPAAPNFGGLWESGVKSIKSHLSRVVGDQSLTYEEFYTVLVQIEGVLNSRPLCPLSCDPNDLQVLTPGHFLTLEPLNSLPDPDLGHIKLGHLSRWQLLQKIHQSFWDRWHREYLHTLLQRAKWTEPCTQIEPNTMVLLKDELAPPSKWHFGRVEKVHKGLDGTTRVVTVRTSKGVLKRPVSKVCPLPNQK